MVSNSKILTVSYGTFSCTLEGFDDSFDTMKAIAEYFRDLAADDRYFGAEPPSPDAEMLARIAEREISRRVEVRGSDGKIHLRADPAALPAAQRAAQQAAADSTVAAQRDDLGDDPAQSELPSAASQSAAFDHPEAPEPEATTAALGSAMGAKPAEPVSDSIAEKLRRIRAVAAPAAAGPSSMSGPAQSAAYFDEDEHAQDFLTETADFGHPEETAAPDQGEMPSWEEAKEQAWEESDEEPWEEPRETASQSITAEPEAAQGPGTEAPMEGSDTNAASDDGAENPLTETAETGAPEVEAPQVTAPQEEPTADETEALSTAPASAAADAEDDADDQPETTFAEGIATDEVILSRLSSDQDEASVADTDDAIDATILDASEMDAPPPSTVAEGYWGVGAEWVGAEEDDLEAMLRHAEAARETSVRQQDDTFEDAAAEAAPERNDTLSQLLADAMISGDDAAPTATTDDADEPASEAQASDADEAQDVDTAPQDLEEQDATDEDATDEDVAAEQSDAERPMAARVIKMKRADLDAALAGGSLEEEMEASGDDPSSLSAEAEAELQRELAEVEAELRSGNTPTETGQETASPSPDMEVPEEWTDLEADDDAENTEAVASQSADSAVSDPRPDHGETDDWEDDRAEGGASDQDIAPTETPSDEDGIRRAGHLGTPASDAQAARIFEEADTQLEEPESHKRRTAIQHLRAAVAATKAERRAGGAMQADVDDEPYRSDLQNAVRPRRPRPVSTGVTPRPSASHPARPAPLKLVAEQRIDTDVQPVRPRRITRADLVSGGTAGTAAATDRDQDMRAGAPGFAEFAEQMGASSLTDMLEAAAAYMADVEGMPQFSRPMLMQKLREAQEDDFTREDGLRSFGELLRQGKLQKLKGGRFAVTSVTEFRQSA
ncbi:hypothetical protein [Roseovarius sp. D0-M9]|uniref:hypothetical protein n=1 Tax=Roseovarius sp. D0-M9 TaxID=3127117 RepID=UPI00300FDEA0